MARFMIEWLNSLARVADSWEARAVDRPSKEFCTSADSTHGTALTKVRILRKGQNLIFASLLGDHNHFNRGGTIWSGEMVPSDGLRWC